MKPKLLKKKPRRMRMSTNEIPTVTTKSVRIRPALATLPIGSP